MRGANPRQAQILLFGSCRSLVFIFYTLRFDSERGMKSMMKNKPSSKKQPEF